jgi:hypothetical protein
MDPIALSVLMIPVVVRSGRKCSSSTTSRAAHLRRVRVLTVLNGSPPLAGIAGIMLIDCANLISERHPADASRPHREHELTSSGTDDLPIVHCTRDTHRGANQADFIESVDLRPLHNYSSSCYCSISALASSHESSPQARPLRRGEQQRNPRVQHPEVNDLKTLLLPEKFQGRGRRDAPLNLAPSPFIRDPSGWEGPPSSRTLNHAQVFGALRRGWEVLIVATAYGQGRHDPVPRAPAG